MPAKHKNTNTESAQDTQRKCAASWCDRRHYARGLCSKHYSRWMRHRSLRKRFVPLQARFEAMVSRADGPDQCHLWTGSTTGPGYGQIGGGKKGVVLLAHRVAWELAHGPIPDGMCVLHKCDVRACVNPTHLFLGTKKDNTHDMLRKGRDRWGQLRT